MTEKQPASKKAFSADWFFRGALTKIGDSLDRLTGRRWAPSSSIATSELVERIKKLLDAEIQDVEGKGMVVPHNIKLKMQWDKFSDESGVALKVLENELLTAAVDHINDSLYYTYAPVSLEVKPDYFVEGVKLYVSFDKFESEDRDVELDVTIPAINVSESGSKPKDPPPFVNETFIVRFTINGSRKEQRLEFPPSRRCSVGRTANDLVLDHSSVSKIHASLVVGVDGILSVADTGSTNGTFINEQRIAYGKAVKLNERDRVKFGEIEVTFEPIPKPVDPEPAGVPTNEVRDESVAIGGFEFKRRVSTDDPSGVDAEADVSLPARADAAKPDEIVPDTPSLSEPETETTDTDES